MTDRGHLDLAAGGHERSVGDQLPQRWKMTMSEPSSRRYWTPRPGLSRLFEDTQRGTCCGHPRVSGGPTRCCRRRSRRLPSRARSRPPVAARPGVVEGETPLRARCACACLDESARRDRRRRQRIALGLAWATIAWNTLEADVAIAAGAAAPWIALIGFGLDSTVEVLSASVIV
jgi:hypothetical protein